VKVLKPFFLFFSIYSAFVGCSKKDSVAAVCYLATSTYVDGSYSSVTTYLYANNKVSASSRNNSSGGTSTYNYNYDQQGRISSVTSSFTNGGSTSVVDETLTYDANGRIIQTLSPTAKVIFTYNSSGQVVKRGYYAGSNSIYTLDNFSTYTYPSISTKNYSSQLDYDGSNILQSTTTFVYDTKQNPEAVIFPDANESTNNVTQATYEYQTSSNPSVVTYTYTYNANGFPIAVTEKNSGYTYTSAYSYTNCK